MVIDKAQLHEAILIALEAINQAAGEAALQAYADATAKDNIAENKYDTLGLEAGYLAHGQAQRVAEYEANIIIYQRLPITVSNDTTPIAVGALIELIDEQGIEQVVFLGPVAGGVKFYFEGKNIVIITPSAPLGKALIGHLGNDVINVNVGGKEKRYEIIALF